MSQDWLCSQPGCGLWHSEHKVEQPPATDDSCESVHGGHQDSDFEPKATDLQAAKGLCECETPYVGTQRVGSIPQCERCGKNLRATDATERPPIDIEATRVCLAIAISSKVERDRMDRLCDRVLDLEAKLRDAFQNLATIEDRFAATLTGIYESHEKQLSDAQADRDRYATQLEKLSRYFSPLIPTWRNPKTDIADEIIGYVKEVHAALEQANSDGDRLASHFCDKHLDIPAACSGDRTEQEVCLVCQLEAAKAARDAVLTETCGCCWNTNTGGTLFLDSSQCRYPEALRRITELTKERDVKEGE